MSSRDTGSAAPVLQGAVGRLFHERGERTPAGANAPILLEDPESAWLVVRGRLNVFAVRVVDEAPEGARDFLFATEAGDLLLGVEPAWADEVGLLAVGTVGAEALRLPLADLRAAAADLGSDLHTVVDRYVLGFSTAVADRGQPQADVLLTAGDHETLPPGTKVSAQRAVAWTHVRQGALHFAADTSLVVTADDGPFPVATGAWLVARDETTVQVEGATTIAFNGTFWDGLRTFQRLSLEWADHVLEADRAAERERMHQRLEADDRVGRTAMESLAGVIGGDSADRPDQGAGDLLAACRLIGDTLGVKFKAAAAWERGRGGAPDQLRAIARTSGVGFRRVVLSHDWWRSDSGPLLGFVREDAPADGEADEQYYRPVALLPTGPSQYQLVDPESGERVDVDGSVVRSLEPFGYQFYRALPARALDGRDLWRFVTFGVWRDARTILAMGALGAGLGLLLPILTGTVFDSIIPNAERLQLANVFVALLVATIATTAFQLTRSFAVIRFHTRVEAGLQMAVLDRLLRLPLPFFRSYSAGDLGLRARGVSAIGHALGGATITSLLSATVSASAYGLLFFYSVPLALLATAILVVNVVFMSGTALFALKYARRLEAVEGRLSGLVLELLSGIAKLRVAGAEVRAFARWSDEFRQQQQLGYKVWRYNNNVEAFNSVLSIASTAALYWAYVALAGGSAGATGGQGLTTGAFLAFNAAFGMFVGGAMQLTGTAIGLVELIPTWERAKPILDTVPEVDEEKPDPGELSGRIEVSHLTFSYQKDGPVILDDVSLEAAPGRLIAIAGPSGAGKSTLLRVLLGFDLPESSSVYYDGHDLAGIDVTAVRRQIGVVLQSSRLTAGDVYTNIVGSGSFTLEDAWEAARMAGMEEELEEMPMGMHTVVSEGGGTLSGGQRQRLLIARALVSRPRILFFDEATSALDNRTQQIVSESVDQLHATRVVIAHRLSTIRNADTIYVLDQGRVVQSGDFDALMSVPGVFADLAARQEA